MNEYQATIKYLQTLKQVYREKGIKKAIEHELMSTFCSLNGRLAKWNNYASMFDSLDWTANKSDMAFREVRGYNGEINAKRLENICNPRLTEELWTPANWTDEEFYLF